MAEGGGEDKENEARRKLQDAAVKLFEKRQRNSEVVDAEGSRIAMPSLSHKWQTIIDDTLIPQMSKHYDIAVKKRSRSIGPDDERKSKRPLSMPNVTSPLPVEIYQEADFNDSNVTPVEVETHQRAPEGATPRRAPAQLEPLDAPPPPPSYDDAIKIPDQETAGPRSMPFYGRLWQMGQRWSDGAREGRGLRQRPGEMDFIEPMEDADARTYAAPLPPIMKKDHGYVDETSFSTPASSSGNWILHSHPSMNEDTDAADRTVVEAEEGRAPKPDRFECNNCFGNRFPRVVRYLNSLTTQNLMILSAVVVIIIGVILFLGLFPASFVYVEYHEMALLKNKVTGTVNRDDVYYVGCYVLGPDKEFVRYPNYGQTISQTVSVYTVDRLEISVSFHLQYYIRSSEVGELHKEYEQDYDGIIQQVIKSEIKNNVGHFNLDYFRLNRKGLEAYILNLLKTRLEGNCCQTCCPASCTNNTLCATCQPANKCYPGYHVDIKYFQLTGIDVPSIVSDLYLQNIVLKVQAEKEFLLQDYAVVQKMTLQKTQSIKNEANEILDAATALASKTLTLAEADREANLTSAYVYGLHYMYLTLGVTSEEHQLSLMFLRVLEDTNLKGNLYKGYGYNMSTIATPN